MANVNDTGTLIRLVSPRFLDLKRESGNIPLPEEAMPDELQACCLEAREEYVERVTKTLTSYPLIKNLPCPKCQRVIPIRIYEPPERNAHS